jgi:Type I phosphodiesterase / nucleotide pyrophosphatase
VTARVVFVVLDGMPDRHVHRDRTPTLWALANGSSRSTGFGGRGRALSCMTSATYPNHATFVTGVDPVDHAIVANRLFGDSRGLLNSWDVGPTAPTVFDLFAHRSTEAVFGDHKLIGAMGARGAGRHWPFDGVRPDGIAYDDYGYADDCVTIDVLLEAVERRPDVLIAQLNSPDTFGHIYGPDSPEALENHRRVDGYVGQLADALDWDNTVLVVVSDHDQELVNAMDPIDLRTEASLLGYDVRVINEGSAAIVRGWPVDGPRLDAIDGVAASVVMPASVSMPVTMSVDDVSNGVVGDELVWSEPGRWFGRASDHATVGVHGGQRTRAQIAIVAGGHPSAGSLARVVDGQQVHARDWLSLLRTHALTPSSS